MSSSFIRVRERPSHSQPFRQPHLTDPAHAGTLSWHLLLGFLASILLACSGADAVTGPSETEAPEAVEVRVTPSEMTLTEGETGDFEATPLDAEGNAVSGYAISWSSSDSDVASVGAGGTVTVHQVGTATIEATASEGGSTVSGSARVEGHRFVGALAIEMSNVELVESDDRAIEVSITDEEGNPVDRAVTWSSSDEAVASVSQEGVVTGRGAGSAIIQASVGDARDSVDVTVFEDNVGSVTVNPAHRTVEMGEEVQLEAEVQDQNGQPVEHPITWSSDDRSVARVDSSGRVVTVGSGDAQITATARGTSTKDGALVIVGTGASPSLEISPSKVNVGVAETVKLDAILKDSEGDETGGTVEWSSTDTTVVTVNNDGTVTGESGGLASIVATMADQPGVADTASVTVEAGVSELAVSPSSLEVMVGETDTLSAEAFDAGGNLLEEEITWTSSDEAIATVDANGLVTAVAVGTTLMVAEYDGVTDTAEVTVRSSETSSSGTTSPPPGPSELSISEDSRTNTSVTYSTSWSASEGADSYSWSAGSNDGLWGKSDSGVTELGVSFTAPRSDADDDSFFCVRAVNEYGESDDSCGGFVIPAAVADSPDSEIVTDSVIVFDPDLYSSTEELMDDPYGVFGGAELGGNINLDTEVGYPGGSHSMRYDYVDQGSSSIHIGRRMPLPKRAKELWIEFDVRFSANFFRDVELDETGETFALKLLFGEVKTQNDKNWKTSEGCNVYRWALYWPSGGSSNPPHGGIGGESPQTEDCQGSVEFALHRSTDVASYFDERWHTVRIHWRHDPGLYELWVDGEYFHSESGYTVDSETDLTAVLLGRNKDSGNPSGTESLWWGTMKVWMVDPGW